MNLTEAARLLTMIASFNNRTVGEGDVIAWQSVLTDVVLADGEEAVRRHFAEHTEWLMPAHVRRLVRDIERERSVAATEWAPGQYGVPKDQAVPELTRGERLEASDVSPEVLGLLSQLRAALPDVPRAKLFPREAFWDRAQQTFRRTEEAAPNPHYRPTSVWMPRAVFPEEGRDICRANGPHDSGVHVTLCPDADEPHQHRASCDGPIGEHLCGFP